MKIASNDEFRLRDLIGYNQSENSIVKNLYQIAK